MQRAIVPEGHNHTTEHFKRSTNQAFLCNASEAVAISSHRMGFSKRLFFMALKWGWVVLVALVLAAAMAEGHKRTVATQQDDTGQQSAPSVRKALYGAWACPGMHAHWLDESTVQCLKETR